MTIVYSDIFAGVASDSGAKKRVNPLLPRKMTRRTLRKKRKERRGTKKKRRE